MFTYNQYLNNECSRNDFYRQFVTEEIIRMVDYAFHDNIIKSTDAHFNDITLFRWDKLSVIVPFTKHMKELGYCNSLSSRVCVLKQAARIIKEKV